jgi:hypothetical protein
MDPETRKRKQALAFDQRSQPTGCSREYRLRGRTARQLAVSIP